MGALTLLAPDGSTSQVELSEAPAYTRPDGPLRSRVAYAAAHVVPKVAGTTPGRPAEIDWDATLAFRRHAYAWGWAWPTRWTPPSATWDWMPRPPAS